MGPMVAQHELGPGALSGALDGCVTPIAFEDAAKVIRDHSIDCVYSLFQVYHQRLWASPARGVAALGVNVDAELGS